MWRRTTSRTASGSKRTTPSDAAVRHASGAAPGPADSASSSAGDDTSYSFTTVATSRAASGPASGDGGSGARYAPAPAAPASNGRFSRCRSAMTSFSCSVYPGSSITSSRSRTGSGIAPGSVAVTIHTTRDRSNGTWR